jgi:hypothetical protein
VLERSFEPFNATQYSPGNIGLPLGMAARYSCKSKWSTKVTAPRSGSVVGRYSRIPLISTGTRIPETNTCAVSPFTNGALPMAGRGNGPGGNIGPRLPDLSGSDQENLSPNLPFMVASGARVAMSSTSPSWGKVCHGYATSKPWTTSSDEGFWPLIALMSSKLMDPEENVV